MCTLTEKEKKSIIAKRYYQNHRNDIIAKNCAYAKEHRAINNKATAKYKRRNPKSTAYNSQKSQAGRLGISWEITKKAWIAWWGDDFALRGPSAEDLCMCRYEDAGPYNLSNIYKATRAENAAGARLCA